MEGMMAVVTNSKNDVVTTILGTVQGLQMLVPKKNQLSLSPLSLSVCKNYECCGHVIHYQGSGARAEAFCC
jgi:hypothetical protein